MPTTTVPGLFEAVTPRGRYRLREIEPFEVSLVDHAANRRRFLVVKRSPDMTLDFNDDSTHRQALDRWSRGLSAMTDIVTRLTKKEISTEALGDELKRVLEPLGFSFEAVAADQPAAPEGSAEEIAKGGKFSAGSREAAERLLSLAAATAKAAPDAGAIKELAAIHALLGGLIESYPSPVAKTEGELDEKKDEAAPLPIETEKADSAEPAPPAAETAPPVEAPAAEAPAATPETPVEKTAEAPAVPSPIREAADRLLALSATVAKGTPVDEAMLRELRAVHALLGGLISGAKPDTEAGALSLALKAMAAGSEALSKAAGAQPAKPLTPPAVLPPASELTDLRKRLDAQAAEIARLRQAAPPPASRPEASQAPSADGGLTDFAGVDYNDPHAREAFIRAKA